MSPRSSAATASTAATSTIGDHGADPPRRPVRSVWLLTAAAALVAALAGVLTRVGDDQSISTADSDTAVVGYPNLTSTFVSPRNGFSVKYFDRGEGTVTPAEQLWGFSVQVDDGFDVVETGLAAVFKGASTEFPGEGPCRNTEAEPIPCGSIDEQIDRYLSDDYVLGGGCGVPRSQQVEITIDGQSGRIAECPNHIEATVVAGGRLYLFTLSHDRGDARAVFDAFVATIELTPETAVDFPGLTSTFVSPSYGYSFQYHDRGGLAPATELWDPVNQPLDSTTSTTDSMAWRPASAPTSRARRHRSRTGSRSMNGSTSTSRLALAAAVSLAASKRRSPSTGSRAGSRSARTRSRRPSSPAGGSTSSPCRTTAVTPGRGSTPGSPQST